MAILDQIGRSGHWIHRRTGFYVHSVQSLCAPLQKVEGLQQNHSSAGKKKGLSVSLTLFRITL